MTLLTRCTDLDETTVLVPTSVLWFIFLSRMDDEPVDDGPGEDGVDEEAPADPEESASGCDNAHTDEVCSSGGPQLYFQNQPGRELCK